MIRKGKEMDIEKPMFRIVHVFMGIAGLFALIIVWSLSSRLIENNESGYVQVIQGSTSGKLSVKSSPGMYLQLFDLITTYKMSDTYDFSKEVSNMRNSKGENVSANGIVVKFNDGSSAAISGQAQFRLPSDEAGILKIHQDFRSYEGVVAMVRRVVTASLTQSANLFRAEDVYSMRRSEFNDLITDQIREGLFSTDWRDEWVMDPDTKEKTLIKRVEIRRDANGSPLVNEKSALKIYGIELVGAVTINNPDFDDLTDGLISKRKEAEQNQVVARANAERAKQDAITAMEEGKRDIAKAEALALVEAKKAIVGAERETKVAQQKAIQAEEEKKAIISKGEADAAATKLKVAAGLSPLEKAQIDSQTSIGVAEKLSQVKFPNVMVIGGNGTDGAKVNPFDAIGLESLMKINRDFINGGKKE